MNNLVEEPKKQTKKQVITEFVEAATVKEATNFKHNPKPRATIVITDYSQLNNSVLNRSPEPNLKLKEDIERWGQLDPIIVKRNKVTGLLDIINGGHRGRILMILGYPIECIELPEDYEGEVFDAVKSCNQSKPWSSGIDGDFMDYHIKNNNPNFIAFKTLTASCINLSETIVYKQVNGKTKSLKSLYENGDLVFEPTVEQESRLLTINNLIGKIISSRIETKTKNYFDKPAIVKLLNDFLEKPESYNLNFIEAMLRKDGYKLNKGTKIEELEKYYRAFTN